MTFAPGTEIRVRKDVDSFAGMTGQILDEEGSLSGFQCVVELDSVRDLPPVRFMYDELEVIKS